jgi:hypothetical protein
MGYEFWKPKGNVDAAIEVGISAAEFSPKVNFGKKQTVRVWQNQPARGRALCGLQCGAPLRWTFESCYLSAKDAGISEVRHR